MKKQLTIIACIGILQVTAVKLSAQAVLVKDINPGITTSSPDYFATMGNNLFFRANKITTGIDPYISNGTDSGTLILKDASDPHSFTVVGSTLYFFADDALENKHLWKSDGTSTGTSEIKQVLAKNFFTDPDLITSYNGMIIFRAYNQLWKSDGSATGTVMIRDTVVNGGKDNSFVELAGKLYFKGMNSGTGTELWVTDGTSAGTMMVKDINPGTLSGMDVVSGGSPDGLNWITVYNGALYFRAEGTEFDDELWKSDGTAAGTVLFKDINTTTGDGSGVCNLTKMNGSLYFTADDANPGEELWKTDGTTAGTVLIAGYNEFGEMVMMNNALYFSGKDGTNGEQLWKSDGTTAGTAMLKVIKTGGNATIEEIKSIGNAVYFSANNGVNGKEPWVSDGTAAGTLMIHDIKPGSSGSTPKGFTKAGVSVFFSADDGVNGTELWKTGTITTGQSRIAKTNKILVYPNPNGGQFTIALSNPELIADVKIINILGETVFNKSISGSEEIQIPEAIPGIYLLIISNNLECFKSRMVIH